MIRLTVLLLALLVSTSAFAQMWPNPGPGRAAFGGGGGGSFVPDRYDEGFELTNTTDPVTDCSDETYFTTGGMLGVDSTINCDATGVVGSESLEFGGTFVASTHVRGNVLGTPIGDGETSRLQFVMRIDSIGATVGNQPFIQAFNGSQDGLRLYYDGSVDRLNLRCDAEALGTPVEPTLADATTYYVVIDYFHSNGTGSLYLSTTSFADARAATPIDTCAADPVAIIPTSQFRIYQPPMTTVRFDTFQWGAIP